MRILLAGDSMPSMVMLAAELGARVVMIADKDVERLHQASKIVRKLEPLEVLEHTPVVKVKNLSVAERYNRSVDRRHRSKI